MPTLNDVQKRATDCFRNCSASMPRSVSQLQSLSTRVLREPRLVIDFTVTRIHPTCPEIPVRDFAFACSSRPHCATLAAHNSGVSRDDDREKSCTLAARNGGRRAHIPIQVGAKIETRHAGNFFDLDDTLGWNAGASPLLYSLVRHAYCLSEGPQAAATINRSVYG